MASYPFRLLNVFADTTFGGNPLCVFEHADGMDDATMQALALQFNLSETTFILPSRQASARVRVFTTGYEMRFAGHPTLGTAHAWLAAGGRPRGDEVLQECGVGLVPLRVEGDRLRFAAPPLRMGEPAADVLEPVLGALGLQPGAVVRAQVLDNGPVWLAVEVGDAEAVLELDPDLGALAAAAPMVAVLGPYPPDRECAVEVRAFAPGVGIPEDPVTGSLHAGIAGWLIDAGVLPERYLAAQGTRLGRLGRVEVERAEGQVWVGGATNTVISGQVDL